MLHIMKLDPGIYMRWSIQGPLWGHYGQTAQEISAPVTHVLIDSSRRILTPLTEHQGGGLYQTTAHPELYVTKPETPYSYGKRALIFSDNGGEVAFDQLRSRDLVSVRLAEQIMLTEAALNAVERAQIRGFELPDLLWMIEGIKKGVAAQ